MINLFKYRFAVGVIICGLLLSSCSNPTTVNRSNSVRNDGERVLSDAEIMYKKKCLSCHGTELQGRAGPSLQNVGSKLNEEEIVDIVTYGRKGMPKFGKTISKEEIQSISKWLSELK